MFILGTKVHNLTLPEALERAGGFLHDGRQHYIVTPNPEIVLQARKNDNYRKILNRADLSLPDGTGLLWASRRFYKKNPLGERITGVDFMAEFLSQLSYGSYGRDRICRILLLGGGGGVAKKAALVLKRKFFNVDFYGIENIENSYLEFTIKEIIQPDCIFVALGAPKQEEWIDNNLKKLSCIKIAMGVGGALDMISGRVPRAPYILRDLGMEWMWRLFLQPWRVGRIFNAAVVFVLLVLRKK